MVLQEIGQAYDTPDDIIFDLFQERAFPDQPMGRPVLGRAEIIRTHRPRHGGVAISSATTPRRGMLLVAAGNLEHDAIVDLAQRAVRRICRPQSAATSEPARYVGGDFREERDLEQVHILLGFPGFAFADHDYLRGLGGVDRARRRHVVAPLPGGPREARPRLFDLFLHPRL